MSWPYDNDSSSDDDVPARFWPLSPRGLTLCSLGRWFCHLLSRARLVWVDRRLHQLGFVVRRSVLRSSHFLGSILQAGVHDRNVLALRPLPSRTGLRPPLARGRRPPLQDALAVGRRRLASEPPAALPASNDSTKRGHQKLLAPPVAAALSPFVASPTFADVVFLVEGRRVPAHRVVLAARCSYFAALLNPDSGFRESAAAAATRSSATRGAADIALPSVSHATFLSVLQFLYAGSPTQFGDCDDTACCALLEAANFFGVEDLRGAVAARLVARLAPSNAVTSFVIATRLGVPSLRAAVVSALAAQARVSAASRAALMASLRAPGVPPELLCAVLESVIQPPQPAKRPPTVSASRLFSRLEVANHL